MTSSASRRWPARRARCTAPARRRARSASSPTSPILTGFKAGYDLHGNTVRGQGGYVAEGFVNIPLSPPAPRCAWSAGRSAPAATSTTSRATITYPERRLPVELQPTGDRAASSSPAQAKRRFNPTETYGGRGALKVNLGDNWTITPTFMGQSTRADGTAFVDPAIPGDLSVQRFYPDYISDQWWQAALTVEGHLSNFDITYAGGYMNRHDHTRTDYSDYSLLYDQNTTYVAYFESNVEPNTRQRPINPSQHIIGTDQYRKMSHELRVTTPKESSACASSAASSTSASSITSCRTTWSSELPTINSVTGWPQILWLTDQIRVDRDYAVFGELSFDFTPKLTGTVGYRFFRYDNSLDGFFGFGAEQPPRVAHRRAGHDLPAGRQRNADGTACSSRASSAARASTSPTR